MKKRIFILSLFLVMALLAGCTGTPTPSASPTQQATATPSGAATTAPATDEPDDLAGYPLPLVDSPVTIDMMLEDHATFPIKADSLVFAELQNRTGIKFNFMMSPQGTYSEKFQITMASGNLPDLVYATTNDSKKYGVQGPYLALDDYLETDMPNLWNCMTELNIVGDLRAADGKIYGAPSIRSAVYGQGMHVRGDWLEEYNIEKPETLDQMMDMLKQFRDLDPAGDGKTIPFGTHQLQFYAFMDAFGTNQGYIMRNDQMIYGPASTNWRDMLVYLAEMYAEQLIDPEFMVLSKAQWEAKVVSGEVAFVAYDMSRSKVFTEMFQAADANTDMRMEPIAPLIGPDGNRYCTLPGLVASTTCISVKSQKADVIMKLYDYMFSEEGRFLGSYGLEDESYFLDDNGDAQFLDVMYENNNFNNYCMNYRAMAVWPTEDYFVKSVKGTLNEQAYELQKPYQIPAAPALTFLEDEQSVLTDKLTLIQDKRDTYFYNIVMGNDTVENSWEDYVAELNRLGLEDVLEVYNTAYLRWKQ